MALEVGTIVKSAPFLIADIVELLTFFSYEDRERFSLSDVVNLLNDLPLQNPDEENEENSSDDSETSLKHQTLAEDVFRHLVTRENRFREWYPFSATVNHIELINRADFTNHTYLYMFLVLCSRLRTLKDRALRVELASYFTEVSRNAMASLLPAHGEVKVFDANSDDRKNYFGTDLRSAIVKLAEYTSGQAMEENCHKMSSSGDGGIDLVGKVNLGDDSLGTLVLFGQCAARETDWPNKTFEASPQRFRSELIYPTDPNNCVFIPIDYRDSNLDWENLHNVNGCLLIDRQRLLFLLEKNNVYIDNIESEPWFPKVKGLLEEFVGSDFE